MRQVVKGLEYFAQYGLIGAGTALGAVGAVVVLLKVLYIYIYIYNYIMHIINNIIITCAVGRRGADRQVRLGSASPSRDSDMRGI